MWGGKDRPKWQLHRKMEGKKREVEERWGRREGKQERRNRSVAGALDSYATQSSFPGTPRPAVRTDM